MRTKAVWFLASTMVLLGGAAIALRAEISPADQQTLKSQYAGKVLMFRKSYRMINKLEVNTDGTVEGDHKPGYWAVDGTVQVKTMEFHKDRITFKCAKLWADIKNDGGLHYFPASAALKGKIGYPAEAEIAFRTNGKDDSLEQLRQRINRIFFGDQESKLSGTPPAIVAYIQKATVEIDIDPISGLGFSGTPPKVVSRPAPEVTREAALVGQVAVRRFEVLAPSLHGIFVQIVGKAERGSLGERSSQGARS